MKLLKDVIMYAIKVDYFMWNAETEEEYTEPLYLSIDTETKDKKGKCVNLIIFREEITDNLRVFNTLKQANEYMETRLASPCCFCENERVIKIKYDFENNRWEEC
jgi:hypothetical protein